MKINQLPDEFNKAKPILEQLVNAGFEAYYVGGSVRDIIMNHEINDVDIATSAYPTEVKQIFHSTVDVGIEHGTVLVVTPYGQYEITTFRTESDYDDFRHPNEVNFVRSLEEDLKRRDFKMNALAMNYNGEIIDLFDGIQDINNKIICAVGNPCERFNEDALRMIRAIRFASQLDFNIENNTYDAIKENYQLLNHISIERIYQEWIKLLHGTNPKKGMQLLIDSNCYQYFPNFTNHKKELNEFTNIISKSIDHNVAFIILAYLFNYNYNEVKYWLKKWKCSNQMINTIAICTKYLYSRLKNNTLSNLELYELGLENIKIIEDVCNILIKNNQFEKLQNDYLNLPIHSIKDLNIDGKILIDHLQMKPGKWMGKFLNLAKEKIINFEWENNQNELLNHAKQFILEFED